MAGPTFAFLHLASTVPTLHELRAGLSGLALTVVAMGARELHLKGERTGSIFVGVGPALELQHLATVEREAIVAALGEVPAHELTGYCMANQSADWDALFAVAERVAERFGGYAYRDRLPARYDGTVTVVMRDFEAFFGARLTDVAYVRANAHLVPTTRAFFIPARAFAREAVSK